MGLHVTQVTSQERGSRLLKCGDGQTDVGTMLPKIR